MQATEALELLNAMSINDMELHGKDCTPTESMIRSVAGMLGCDPDATAELVNQSKPRHVIALCAHSDDEDETPLMRGLVDVSDMQPSELCDTIMKRLIVVVIEAARRAFELDGKALYDPDTAEGQIAWEALSLAVEQDACDPLANLI